LQLCNFKTLQLPNEEEDMIIIVDFGGQTANLIGRRLRQLGVQSEYANPEEALKEIQKKKPAGIIFSGGPAFVTHSDAPTIEKKVYDLGIPILGICYGWQLMAYHLGAEISGGHKEFGPEKLVMIRKNVFGIPDESCQVIMSHGDSVMSLPDGFEIVASTKKVKHAAAQDMQRKFIGVQFHPEVDHTEHGLEMLRYFLAEICCEEIKPFVLDPAKIIADIKKTVGKKKVICAVSGGVDSTVTAALIGKAIGKHLIPIFVDSGLMRTPAKAYVEYIFKDLIPADLIVVEARQRFLEALAGITDPEEKRKTIGKLYIDIFQEQSEKHTDASFLGQGTIYSDVIESKGSKHAS
jgi:GMP synthase (glutamine-hydrolysing)